MIRKIITIIMLVLSAIAANREKAAFTPSQEVPVEQVAPVAEPTATEEYAGKSVDQTSGEYVEKTKDDYNPGPAPGPDPGYVISAGDCIDPLGNLIAESECDLVPVYAPPSPITGTTD